MPSLIGAPLAARTALALCAVPAIPAAAATSGPETIGGTGQFAQASGS
jgi:hypothetical protein